MFVQARRAFLMSRFSRVDPECFQNNVWDHTYSSSIMFRPSKRTHIGGAQINPVVFLNARLDMD